MGLDPIEAQFVMFKGNPGTRKSTQALTYPKPQEWFDWDQKFQSMYLPMIKWGMKPSDFVVNKYSDWDAPRKRLEQLQVNCKAKTIVLDSITSAANSTLRQTLSLKRGTTKKSGGDAGRLVAGIPVNEIEDYNAEASALLEMIALCKDIHKTFKVNIILIAHVIQAEYKAANQTTSVVRTIVTAGKRVAPQVPAYCEEVYHFDIVPDTNPDAEGKYSLITSGTSDDFARTSLPLEHRLTFGNEQLYPNYIQPSITKLNEQLKGLTA